jgi:predicted NodU family carbamoyl transferase
MPSPWMVQHDGRFGQSSSLVTVHLVCESLLTGESRLAISGGVHLNLTSETALLETEFGAVLACPRFVDTGQAGCAI